MSSPRSRKPKNVPLVPAGASAGSAAFRETNWACSKCRSREPGRRASLEQLERLHGIVAEYLIKHFDERGRAGKKPLISMVRESVKFLDCNSINSPAIEELRTIAASLPSFEEPLA